jgi:hypothetical protein
MAPERLIDPFHNDVKRGKTIYAMSYGTNLSDNSQCKSLSSQSNFVLHHLHCELSLKFAPWYIGKYFPAFDVITNKVY